MREFDAVRRLINDKADPLFEQARQLEAATLDMVETLASSRDHKGQRS